MVEGRHEEFNKIHIPREKRAGKKDMKKDEDRENKGSIDS